MKRIPPASLVFFACCAVLLVGYGLAAAKGAPALRTFTADNKNFQYVGRIDFTDPKLPKFWTSGVYVRAKFQGSTCDLLVNDEVLWGKSHNYIEVAIDDRKPVRIQTTGPTNTLRIAEGLSDGEHTLTICKDTESNIGYLQFVGLRCAGLAKPSPLPKRKLEFIGDSITCGAGSDESANPCGKGEWYDQHNAYGSYGPSTARLLNARWHLTSVSGIGLMHSCCDMKITMPDVYHGMNLRDGSGQWDFSRYQPDAVTVCLGQNDGLQEKKAFVERYVAFLRQIRRVYPKAHIVCLTSPMGDPNLTAGLKERLTEVADRMHQSGDTKVHTFFFSRSYNGGCGGHPNLAEHQKIAAELSAYLKTTLHW